MIKLSTKKIYNKLVGISELASLFLTFLFQKTAPGPFSYHDLRETGPWNANCVMSTEALTTLSRGTLYLG